MLLSAKPTVFLKSAVMPQVAILRNVAVFSKFAPVCAILSCRSQAFVAMAAVTALALNGCAPGVSSRSLGAQERPNPEIVVVESDPQQLQAEAISKQKREIAKLREELVANRARADAAAERAESVARETQAAIRALQTELAQVKARADTASTQSDKAFQIATEFLSNLVAAREEQRAIVERNLKTFDTMDQRIAAIENLVAETRRNRDMEVAANRSRSAEVGLRLQEADRQLVQLREQLTRLSRDNEQTRAAIESGPMLRMMRELESARRDTTVLRGAIEEMQREQEAARKRMQDYYVDLDARIQALQERERAARQQQSKPKDAEDGVLLQSPSTPGAASDGRDSNASGAAAAADTPTDYSVEQEIRMAPLPPPAQPHEDSPETGDNGAARSLNGALPDGVAARADETSSAGTAGEGATAVNAPGDAPASFADALDSAIEDDVSAGAAVATQQTSAHTSVEPPPATAHGLLITDWQSATKAPARQAPVDSAESPL